MFGQNPKYNFEGVSQRPPPSSYMRQGTAGRVPTAFRSSAGERPVTSNRGAGFPATSAGKRPEAGSGNTSASGLKPLEETPELMFKRMEKEVNTLLDKSSEAKLAGNLTNALNLAKEAVSKEKKLRNLKEDAGLAEQINVDLTYGACVNLGIMYQANGMFQEALNTYSLVVRNKDYPSSGRLRVNMGNIYYSQKKYSSAVKMYRMALDQLQNIGKHMKFQIMCNIANTFVQMGQYHDAIESYETIIQGEPTHKVAYNLLLCYYALGDTERMKKTFTQMLMIEIPGSEEDDEMEETQEKGPFANDALSEYIKEMRRDAFKFVIDSAKLIAPVIEKDWITGYEWVAETLRASDYSVLESEIGIYKAEQYIRMKDYEQAIEVFKSFEKKDQNLMARAATNISFLYFIERDFKNADRYADIAIKNDRYNAKALVNKGNCLFRKEDLESAKEFYLEAIGVEADCVEAIYNLGIVNRKLENDLEALQAFEKLQTIMSNAPEVMYHIASIYENARNYNQAIKWYNLLLTNLPNDPGVLLKLGQLYEEKGDENQSFHYYMESYRNYPVNLDVVSWLAVFYAKSELFEKALTFFERASQIQPQNYKWRIMVASCYRRMGNDNKALEIYEQVHQEHPENIECLQVLVTMLKGTGQNYEHYNTQLKKLLRDKEMNQPVPNMQEEEPPMYEPPPAREVQQRPGTSRKGRKVASKQVDEDDWVNQDIELP